MNVARPLVSRGAVLLPFFALSSVLSGCTMPTASLHSRTPLVEQFACLREKGLAVVSAHRGAPDATHAENTLAAYAEAHAHGFTLAETDIRPTRDGVLMLSHDPDLDRITTLTGPIVEHDWAEISAARMRTREGAATHHAPATLPQLLAETNDGPVLQLDIKAGTDIVAVLDAVEAADAGGRVIFLAYTDADIATIAHRMPGAIVATVIPSLERLAQVERLGIAPDHLHALFFESAIDRPLFAELRKRGVTVLVAAAEGEESGPHESHPLDAERYRAILAAGAQIVVSDHPTQAEAALGGKGC